MVNHIEKSAISSKKFIAYFLSSITTKMIIVHMISRNASDFAIMGMIVSSSFIDIGYILGQAALDKYVRVALLQTKRIVKSTPTE
jgi:hypothetical protein